MAFKIHENHKKSKFGLGVGPEAPQDSPGIPKVLQKLSKVSPKGTQKYIDDQRRSPVHVQLTHKRPI